MTKDELLNGLNNILNNFLYGFIAPKLVAPEAWQEASGKTALFKGRESEIEIQLGPVSKRVFDLTLREGFIRNYENSLLRAMIRESHELILLYCHETNQSQTYKTEPWFQFVRILRNVVSHKKGGNLREWPKDLLKAGVTSVAWRKKAFDIKMVGTDVIFYPTDGLELLGDLINFVERKIM